MLHCKAGFGKNKRWRRALLYDNEHLVANLSVAYASEAPSTKNQCNIRICTKAWGGASDKQFGGADFQNWVDHLRVLRVDSVVVNALGTLSSDLDRAIRANRDIVTLRTWAANFSTEDRDHYWSSAQEALHRVALNHCYQDSAMFTWAFAIDMDEYIRTKGCNAICAVLRTLPRGPGSRYTLSGVRHRMGCTRTGPARFMRSPPCPSEWDIAANVSLSFVASVTNASGALRLRDDHLLSPHWMCAGSGSGNIPMCGWKSVWNPDLPGLNAYGGPHDPGLSLSVPRPLPSSLMYVAHRIRSCLMVEKNKCAEPPYPDAEFDCSAKN